jgi:uncharacterized protein YndB with AHSA1/START domain
MDATMTVTKPSDREVRAERILQAPPETVWLAFTEPDLVAQWWARGNPMTVERYEVEPGGHWRFVEHAPDGDFGFEGRFGEVEPPTRLTQTFEWDGAPAHVSLNSVEFEEIDPNHTRVIEKTMFMTADDAEQMLSNGMLDGMAESYAALDRLVASMR